MAATGEIARILGTRGVTDKAIRLALTSGFAGRIRPYQSAMTAIAPHLTKQKVVETIATIESLKQENVRILLLLPLLPYAGPEALQRIVEASRESPWAMAALAPLLSGAERHRSMPASLPERVLDHRWFGGYSALEAILPYLDRAVVREAWDRILTTRPLEDKKREALVLLSSRLGQDELSEALQISVMLDKPQRARMLARTVRAFTRADQRRDVLNRAIGAAESLQDRDLRAASLMACAFAADGAKRDDLFERAFVSAAEEDAIGARQDLLYALGPFIWHDRTVAAQILERILPICSARPRGDFLGDLAALRYTLHFAAGSAAIARAIRAAKEWWP